MKTMGMIGGMSWESTLTYYAEANRLVREKLGGLHSGRIILHSVDFHEIEAMQAKGDWQSAGRAMAEAAVSLERAGADFFIICTNTMHKVAAEAAGAVSIPLLHIADATAEAVKEKGLGKVGLLGTSYTMVEPFYKGVLEQRHGLHVVVPGGDDLQSVHRIIYEELCLGKVREQSREAYRTIIGKLADAGAEGVILGCTEIGLLIGETDSPLPVFDTARIHVERAVETALS